MRLLLINYEYPPIGAGASNAAWHIANELYDLGCEVSVLTAQFRDMIGISVEDGVRVHRVPALRHFQDKSSMVEMASFVLSAAAYLPTLFGKERIDAAIVFFSMPCGPLGLLAKWMSGIPYVISLRGGDVPGNEAGLSLIHLLLRPVRRMVLRYSEAVVANSDGLGKKSMNSDPYPVHVIPNGVDTAFFSPLEHRNEQCRFLFAGRFQAQKNLFYLLEQMGLLKRSSSIPFELHMAGHGPLHEELQRVSRYLRIDELITWHGWCDREKIRELYRTCDCLVNPSLYEGMANVVLEAMACGMAVVASNVIGNNDLIEHEKTGWLFSLGDPESFQALLRRVLDNPNEINLIGRHARETVCTSFSWKSVAEQYLALLEKGRCKKGRS